MTPKTLGILAAFLLCSACSDAPSDQVADTALPPTDAVASALPTLPKFGDVVPDSGPPVQQVRSAAGVRLVMDPAPGDQINALQPPVLVLANGQRLLFAGSAVTKDSAYFVGEVALSVPAATLPLRGELTTSYCRKGENLCRTAKRQIAAE
ncbi:hypothetical protein [Gemmatimonas phototrophica]|uniref:Uncharacterized protein n=1 Tax=Gemmatimonas phototrophica TaxID=1379270 RepID=A0A143BFK8_9BACT|nr:hypothetical protein [Gemmatimonas phototrophica]AMW03799.1 hypothetical protein GEMMAAP_00985 [Gemmatimonas phototrophica]